jgi:4-hydroxy-3-polyprenylbenzoate decarboxylase
VPYRRERPQELLTIANAILGFGQASLAKYLLIAAKSDDASLDVNDVGAFLDHVLRRVDFEHDLHFHTRTTIDTLDYSGSGLNAGSKLVVAARGEPRRELCTELPALTLPDGFSDPRLARPGIAVVAGPRFDPEPAGDPALKRLTAALDAQALAPLPLIVVVDDAELAARNFRNFLWVTFTRSNPSHDVHGVGSFIEHKHWGCRGPLVIDARIKPRHAPPLVEDPEVSKRVDALAASGGPLHGLI